MYASRKGARYHPPHYEIFHVGTHRGDKNMTAIIFRHLDKIDYVSGCVILMEFTIDDQATYYVVRVEQYCKNLEYIRVPTHAEAKTLFLQKLEEYKEKLSQGRHYIDLQLAEREDGV